MTTERWIALGAVLLVCAIVARFIRNAHLDDCLTEEDLMNGETGVGDSITGLGRALATLVTFNDLRIANVLRLPLFKDRRGNRAHTEPDGSDWSLAEWMNAVAGEVGEACNIAKKIRRGDFGASGSSERDAAETLLMKELADIVIYCDLTAYQLRRSLGDAVRDKFNEVSERIDCYVRMEPLSERVVIQNCTIREVGSHCITCLNNAVPLESIPMLMPGQSCPVCFTVKPSRCVHDTDKDGNCAVHPAGCPVPQASCEGYDGPED